MCAVTGQVGLVHCCAIATSNVHVFIILHPLAFDFTYDKRMTHD